MEDLHESDVAIGHYYERLLARESFNAAQGQGDNSPTQIDEMIDLLDDIYKKYGLSSGVNATTEMVRGFMAAAASQARSGGRDR